MKLVTPEIAWHGKEPVLSVDFCKVGSTCRMASAGADKDIKIWSVTSTEDGSHQLRFLSNLSRHNKAVNVVRFSPKEELLASAGDDSIVFIWKLSSSSDLPGPLAMECDDGFENQETWTVSKNLRGHIEDVYDLAWSPDGAQLISGSVDNSAIIWDANKGTKLVILKDHKHYVQGVCWDPLNQYVVTNSSDRSCRLYNAQTFRCTYNINKLAGTAITKTAENGEPIKPAKMFHDETMQTFFRRPTYTPDGSLLIVPSGKLELSNHVIHTTYVFSRNSPNKPMCFLQSPKKPTVAVRCCPALFELRSTETEKGTNQDSSNLTKLPYRMIFAVATMNSVLLYDTQQKIPFGYISNIHYSGISDMTWSNTGNFQVISSTDGYCSIVQFKDGELGTPYKHTLQEILDRPNNPLTMPYPSKTIHSRVTPSSVSDKTTAEAPGNASGVPDQAPAKKKEPRGISQFTVPMSQIKESKPGTPRRVPLVSTVGQTGVLSSQPYNTSQPQLVNQMITSGQSQPRRVQLVTVPGQSVGTVNQPVAVMPSQTVYYVSQPGNQPVQLVTTPVVPGQAVQAQPLMAMQGQVVPGQVGTINRGAPQQVVLLSAPPGNQQPNTNQVVIQPLRHELPPGQTVLQLPGQQLPPGKLVLQHPVQKPHTAEVQRVMPVPSSSSQPRRVQLVSAPDQQQHPLPITTPTLPGQKLVAVPSTAVNTPSQSHRMQSVLATTPNQAPSSTSPKVSHSAAGVQQRSIEAFTSPVAKGGSVTMATGPNAVSLGNMHCAGTAPEKRRIPLMPVPLPGTQTSNQAHRENQNKVTEKRPIPLEPKVIVIE